MYKISYTGDGSNTEFVFSFPFFQNADIKVAIDNVLLDDTQYDVNPNSNFNGGSVVFASAPLSGKHIDIFRKVSLDRIIDYQPTQKIDPEDLNSDFNFLLAAFQDLHDIDIDLSSWENIHDNVLTQINYALQTIEDKLSGGAVLGLYNNLLNVLDNALPSLINDYGYVTESANNENNDDYGSL
ncbi:MAG: hypothetical protein J6W08_02265 [Alphaproteobacteria bacterium]|nr:hypothetical protein [Alphaproteobacteria bacterium]